MKIVDVVTVSDTASTVLWSPPTQPNGIVADYKVIYSIYENSTNISVSVSNNTENFNITDLCKLHTYACALRCVYVYFVYYVCCCVCMCE